jgi:hypothetical protein
MNINVFDAARQAAYERLNAYWDDNHPGVPIAWGNQVTVDMAQQVTPFIAIEIVWNDGAQATIEDTPIVRYSGAIHFGVYTKAGTGRTAAFGWMGELANLFKTDSFGGIITYAPKPMPCREWKGWVVDVLRVPFATHDA